MENQKKNEMGRYSNTPHLNTTEKRCNAIVDWLEVTFKGELILSKIFTLFKLEIEDFEFLEYGGDYYKNSCRYGHITLLYNGVNADMGIHIRMSGQGCREYEKFRGEDFNWVELFKELLMEDVNISRFDLAIDDYQQKLNIKQMYRLAKKGCMLVPRVNVARYIEEIELKTGHSKGQTLQVGKADWTVRFYDKKEERIAKGIEVNLESWNRYEIELHKEIAKQAMQELINPEITVGYIVKAFLKTKIDFKVKHKTDTNRSRWNSQKFWVKFLEDVEQIEFVKKEADYSVQRSFRWVETSVTSTLAMLQQATEKPEVLREFLNVVGKQKLDNNKQKHIDIFKKDEQAKSELYEYMYSVIENSKREEEKENSYGIVKSFDEYMQNKKHISAKDMLVKTIDNELEELFKNQNLQIVTEK